MLPRSFLRVALLLSLPGRLFTATPAGAYGQLVGIRYGGQPEEGSVRVALTFVRQEDASILTARLEADRGDGGGSGGEPPSFAIQGPWKLELASYLANVLFFLWSSRYGYLGERLEPAPELVEELPVEAIARSVLPDMPPVLVPTSVAVSGSGSLLVGLSLLCVELDPSLRLLGQPGRSLYDQGNYAYAYAVAATPAGSVFLKPGLGRELYRLGILHAEFGREPEAEKAFLEGAQADPGGVAALLNLVALRLARDRKEDARQALEQTLRRRPDSAQAKLLLTGPASGRASGGASAPAWRQE